MIYYQSSQRKEVIEKLSDTHPAITINVLRTFADREIDVLDIAINKPKNVGKLIIDSGTFSKNTSGRNHKNLTLEGYRNFLIDHASKFDGGAFNYDEAFREDGAEINNANMKYLNYHGLNVIPVIQDESEVDYYCKNASSYPYVAFGSGYRKKHRNTDKGKELFKKDVIKLCKSNVKVHLLAEASYNFLKDIPVYSSDSKSCIDYTRLRQCCYFDLENDKETRLFLDLKNKKGEENKYYYKKHPLYKKYSIWLDQNFGWKISDLYIGYNLLTVNAYYYWWLEQRINEKHKELNILN
jgi:hypothetical protein